MSTEVISTTYQGRPAWVLNAESFTSLVVDGISGISWNEENPSEVEENSNSSFTAFKRMGTATLSMSRVLTEEIEDWMKEHGYEYELDTHVSAPDAGYEIIMFDPNVAVLFKLTWTGIK
jgi:hypothetical protein